MANRIRAGIGNDLSVVSIQGHEGVETDGKTILTAIMPAYLPPYLAKPKYRFPEAATRTRTCQV